MAAIITEKFRTHNAKQFKEDFGESASSSYIFIGRSFDWADENDPPAPANSVGEEIDAWSDMIALKKVGSADVSHGITRYDWTNGVGYDEYQHNVSATNTSTVTSANNVFDSRFYVLTDEYNVYKCIRTGRDASGSTVVSSVKPTGTSATLLVETQDALAAAGRGYLWKFMYAISASDTIKFVTNDFIPVKTLGAQTEIDGTGTNGGLNGTATDDGSALWDVENEAVDGAVSHIVVTNGGSGYTNGTHTAAVIDGDGSLGRCSVVVAGGAVTHILVTTAGTGYKRASVDIDEVSGIGGGSSATASVVISPLIGHGADAVQELGGNYVIVNARLEFAEGTGDFPTDNDFRRIGLIQDPFSTGTTLLDAATAFAYSKLSVTSAAGIAVDDILRSAAADGAGVAVGRVLSVTGTTISYLPQANSEGGYVDFVNSDDLFEGAVARGAVNAVPTVPEVVRYSGQILYIENRGAVTRASDQIEDIKLIIEM